jgi:hypothetical protein
MSYSQFVAITLYMNTSYNFLPALVCEQDVMNYCDTNIGV